MDRSTSLWIAIIGFSLLGATALYSCVPHIREDISARALDAAGDDAAPSGWASIQVDGQRLVVTGTPPDAQRADVLVRKLARIDGVIEVDDQFSEPARSGSPEVDQEADQEAVQDGESTASLVPSVAEDSASADRIPPVSGPGAPGDSSASDRFTATQPGSPGNEIASVVPADVAEPDLQPPIPAEAVTTPTAVDPIIQAAEAGPGRPLLSEPLSRCQREIDALLTGSASFFTSASSDITADALPVVDQVAALLAQCNARAEVAGHTDNSGRTRPNQQLSQARADAIRAHLIVRGVPETQVSSIGFGEERPIVSNRTPEGRRQNRRIEVRIVDGQISSPSTAPTGTRS